MRPLARLDRYWSPLRTRPRRGRPAAVLLGSAAALLLLSGCAEDDRPRLGFPTPVTEEGPRMLLLWQGTWLAAILVGIAVWGLILWASVFHRKKSDDEIPIQTRYNLPIEVLYTIVPFVIISVLFYFTERDQSTILDNDRDQDMTVQVVGKQWSWQFNYVEDEVYETGTPAQRPELWLPVNNLVRFELTSPDVIHSFWVPSFLFKLDVIPGRVNAFELTPNKIGTFSGKCAELCGVDHSRMFFDVRVVSEADYRAHVEDLREAGQTGALPRGILGTAEERERLYNLEETYDTDEGVSGETPGGQAARAVPAAAHHAGGHS